MIDVKTMLAEFKEAEQIRELWKDQWQLIGEYIHGASLNFTEKNANGDRLNDFRNTSKGVFASRSLQSVLIGNLWPNGAKSMKLERADGIKSNKANNNYFVKATERLVNAMDDPLAGLTVANDEYMLDQVAFGNSGIGAFRGTESVFSFDSWGVMDTYILEGEGGRPSVIFRLREWTLRRIIETYGLNNLSEKLQKLSKSKDKLGSKYKILHCIKKRTNRDPSKKGALDMPYVSAHIELDGEHLIRESGFDEMPVIFNFFRKLSYEIYGRGAGNDALSDVLEADYLIERFTVNVDKSGDPPLMILDDGKFGGGIIDMSARAINVVDVTGRPNNNIDPIKPLFTVGELNTTLTRLDQLSQDIAQHFMLDKLLDFNSQTEMTARETITRERIRGASVSSVHSRQYQMYDRLVSRCFNMMLKDGLLGVEEGSAQHQALEAAGEDVLVIPEEIAKRMAKGEDVYKIRYFTPAARMAELHTYEALIQHVQFVQNLANSHPDAVDTLDSDRAAELSAEITGMFDVSNSEDEILDIRKKRIEEARQAQEVEQAQEASEAVKNLSDAGLA